MGKIKGTKESSNEFLKIIKEWQVLEGKTITSAEALIRKTNNLFVKTMMEMIKRDSEKHKVMQQMIIDNITKEAVHLSPDELFSISDLLEKHVQIEAKSIEIAETALKKSELFLTRYILSYLIADETKHHDMINRLNELKKAVVFVT